MHDFQCGIIPIVLKLVIHHYVYQAHLFNLPYLNSRIASFQYGFTEKKSKPSPNFTDANTWNINDHSLSQKAMQTWCLVRVFPFLLTEKVPKGNKHMQLILLLLRIMEIVFAPKISRSILPYLRYLINDFFEVFKKLYPDVNFINKFHHLVHYPDCIRWMGPLTLFWCMRFEVKHGQIKERGQVVHNFKNCPKTLLRVCQCTQSAQWGGKDLKIYSVISQGGKTAQVEDTLSRRALLDLGYEDTDFVFRTRSVKVNGSEYRNELLVCLDAKGSEDINLPQFGVIKEILILEQKKVYLQCSLCETSHFDPDLNAYSIRLGVTNGPTCFILTSNLAYFKSLSIWTVSTSADLFVTLRHIIL